MAFPYHFVSLTEDQNERRRYLLDSYGQFAQLSVLLLPLIYQLSLGVSLLLKRLGRSSGYQSLKEHQSPVVNRTQGKRSIPISWSWRRVSWYLDDEIAPRWETRKEWLMAGLWAAWLLLLVVKDTGDDYLHVTRRFGIVAASQLPIHYLLAAKAWSPIQYLTRMSHEELNPYHRLLGRIIVLLFACHAILYLNFYVQKGLLSKRIREWDVILGLIAISIASILFTTALARIRNYSYRLFFYMHVILSISLLPILYLHVSHLRLYILETAAVFALLIIQRNISQATAPATISLLAGTNLLSITIPLTKPLRSKSFTAGQHIYIGFPSLLQKLRINPFTIANNPCKDSSTTIQLFARSLNGTTNIFKTFSSKFQPTPLILEGPYGSAKYFPDFTQTYDRILLVAGGVGATFTLPLFCHLRDVGGEYPEAKLVWTVRDLEDATWGVEMLQERYGDRLEGVELYVTGREGPAVRGVGWNGEMDDEEGMELQERSEQSMGGENARMGAKRGRPDLRAIVDGMFESGDVSDRVAVLVCGPRGMGASLRKEVGRWIAKGRDVFWHKEEFGW